jgi:hypothetical protein
VVIDEWEDSRRVLVTISRISRRIVGMRYRYFQDLGEEGGERTWGEVMDRSAECRCESGKRQFRNRIRKKEHCMSCLGDKKVEIMLGS